MRFSKSILFCLFLMFLCQLTFAQRIEGGLGLGPTFYKGDLQPRFVLFNPRIATNAFFRYNFFKTISVKANVMAGIVGGDDKKSRDPVNKLRDYSFNSKLMDYNVQVEYNFFNFRTHDGKFERNWTPYLFAGGGQYKVFNTNFKSATQGYTDKSNQKLNTTLVYGIGMKKILFRQFNFGFEFGSRVLLNAKNNDLFDGLGYVKPDINSANINTSTVNLYHDSKPLDNKLLHANTVQPDKYFYASISVSYLFYKIYCPVSIK